MLKFINLLVAFLLSPGLIALGVYFAGSMLGWPVYVCYAAGAASALISFLTACRGYNTFFKVQCSDAPLELRHTVNFLTRLLAIYSITAFTAIVVGLATSCLVRLDAAPSSFSGSRFLRELGDSQQGFIPVLLPEECRDLVVALRYGAAIVAGLLAWRMAVCCFFPRAAKDPNFVRGRQLNDLTDVQLPAKILVPANDPGIPWGGIDLPSDTARKHLCVVGATGSGKTTMILRLMNRVLPQIGLGLGHRALIYDPKQEFMSHLAGMHLSCPVVVLNPFDKRGAAWDMAKDVTGPATALEVATILIPEEQGTNRFFPDAARDILTGVFISFIKTSPGAWTFRDVILAMETQAALREVLARTPETRPLIGQYLEAKEWLSIQATIATKMAKFRAIAAAWSGKRMVCLRDWIRSEFILLLGNDETTRTSIDAINQVIFKLASQLILVQPESKQGFTWVILDEVREMGKLDGLSRLLTMGRSHGACCVLGFQDTAGLEAVYGDKVASELIGQCATKAILLLASPKTAKWASEVLGEFERYEFQHSMTNGPGGVSTTESKQLTKRETMLSSQFMTANPRDGLWGCYLTPSLGAYTSVLPWKELRRDLLSPNTEVANFVPIPEDNQYLVPWTEEDLRRLRLELNASSPAATHSLDPKPVRQLRISKGK